MEFTSNSILNPNNNNNNNNKDSKNIIESFNSNNNNSNNYPLYDVPIWSEDTLLDIPITVKAKGSTMIDLLHVFGNGVITRTEGSGSGSGNNGWVTYTLNSSITIDDSNSAYFPMLMPDNTIFDGGYIYETDNLDIESNPITIYYKGSSPWKGLFRQDDNITFKVMNVKFSLDSSTSTEKFSIEEGHGCIIGSNNDGEDNYAKSKTNITVSNCHLYSSLQSNIPELNNHFSGGIVGSFFAAGSGSVGTIENCTNSLKISGENIGGICGSKAGGLGGTLYITNCSNSGDISYKYSGGICGEYAGYKGTVYITSCSNSGELSAYYNGGICGHNAATSGTVYISNCCNTGNIYSGESGGICGSEIGNDSGLVVISYCWNEGEIGILTAQADGTGSIEIIKEGHCGGIVGSALTNCIIKYCYNIGKISGPNAGGITGGYTSMNSGTITVIFNCYSNADGNGTDNQGACTIE